MHKTIYTLITPMERPNKEFMRHQHNRSVGSFMPNLQKGFTYIFFTLAILLLSACQISLDELNTTTQSEISTQLSQIVDTDRTDQKSRTIKNFEEENNDNPISISGEVAYTSPYFYQNNPDPYITLYNVAPFYGEQEISTYKWIREAQQLGMVTSSPYISPFTYQLLLPAKPAGPYVDLNFDEKNDFGLAVYTVNLVSNVSGDPFLDFAYGDSLGSMSSVVWGFDEVYGNTFTGGSIIVYAPDKNQTFPMGFGLDGILFTEDDPLISLPFGYTIVTLDSDPFELSRTQNVTIDLLEPAEVARIDFTAFSYSEAFDKLLGMMEKEYAYTEHYGIEWEKIGVNSLENSWRMRIAEAERAQDYDAYITTLYDFARTFEDGHVSIEYEEYPLLLDRYDGSIGIIVQESDQGDVFITDVIPNLPADRAGIKPGAVLLSIDGLKASDAIDAVVPYYPSGLPSARHWRLLQMIYVERGQVDGSVMLNFQNLGESEQQDVTLTRVFDWNGPTWTRFYVPEMPMRPLPLEFDLLPNGYGHIKFYSFFDDVELTLDLWDRAINTLNREEIPGVVLDMRNNEGGSLWLAELAASYFFDKNVALGAFTYYDPESEDFLYNAEDQRIMYPIPSELYYGGKIVVLIGPDCNSACEFFSYAVDQKEETQILGYYASAGLGGAVEPVYMPDGIIFNFTTGRAVDATGKIHIEGIGIQPDLRVPITREAILSKGDALLRAAEIALDLSMALDDSK